MCGTAGAFCLLCADLVEALLAVDWGRRALIRLANNLLCGTAAFIDLDELFARQQLARWHKWITVLLGLAFYRNSIQQFNNTKIVIKIQEL